MVQIASDRASSVFMHGLLKVPLCLIFAYNSWPPFVMLKTVLTSRTTYSTSKCGHVSGAQVIDDICLH